MYGNSADGSDLLMILVLMILAWVLFSPKKNQKRNLEDIKNPNDKDK